jgi:glycosyltransferase involved in cell wall biosynthesis
MPVGVDTDHFTRLPHVSRDPRGILFLGRITPSKRPHLLVQALGLLAQKGVMFTALLCGAQALQDRPYIKKLEQMIEELGLSNSVHISPGVPLKETPELFNRHAVFVNCSPSGMYDKTLFEAASCECAVVASSKDFAELVPPRFIFEDGDVEDLAKKLEALLVLPVLEQQGIGAQMHNVAKQYSLSILISRLVEEMQ